ncbi:MAG TPA: ArsR family transcriptional regulator [Euryarchaeota archaeon]|nr:ArsR family transcriptional regulator [Euryarchaeota archaeon]
MTNKIELSKLLSELEKEGTCTIVQLPIKKEILVPDEEAERVYNVLKMFSEQSKLRILLLLHYNGSLPVCIISKSLGLDQTLVSHHLKLLKEVRLVEFEKAGKYKLYRLTKFASKIMSTIMKSIIKENLHTEITTKKE